MAEASGCAGRQRVRARLVARHARMTVESCAEYAVGSPMYQDLREFIAAVDKLGALRRIDGADPRFEIGGITEVAAGSSLAPALLFDVIKGFPPGFRVLTNAVSDPQRAALALGIDPTLRPL